MGCTCANKGLENGSSATCVSFFFTNLQLLRIYRKTGKVQFIGLDANDWHVAAGNCNLNALITT